VGADPELTGDLVTSHLLLVEEKHCFAFGRVDHVVSSLPRRMLAPGSRSGPSKPTALSGTMRQPPPECDIEGFALDGASCNSWKGVNPRAGPAAIMQHAFEGEGSSRWLGMSAIADSVAPAIPHRNDEGDTIEREA